ncbi:MAG: caspase family protein, partial [Candidatus Aminicenantaceae bacterium]
MGKKVLLLFLSSILILCLYPFAQRGFKVMVRANDGSSIALYTQYRALVIGVSDYLYWPRLPNAVKDAREVGTILKEQGFHTQVVENPTSEEMKKFLNALVSLERRADDGVLLYYAGHGDTIRLAD